ncbi:hypothetical protein [Acrocarpospora sp. B8E8]|uniref:hypothetical protein n=1 Tax=Acrocarpospora sp. B8E8 TaxID=3153572 RepID=UPI00325CB45E
MSDQLVHSLWWDGSSPGVALDGRGAAELLRTVLVQHYGIVTDLHAGHGVAFLSVWADLLVWSNGRWFWWAAGRVSALGRPVYAVSAALDVSLAARRVALRYDVVRRERPLPGYRLPYPR